MMDRIINNSIKYLYNISELMPNCFPTPKSIYASKSRILELRSNVFLPKKITKATIRCQRCCLSFYDYPPSVVLHPKKKVDKFTKKILLKSEENEPLTPYQRKRLERSKNLGMLSVKKICSQCRHETTFTMIDTKPENPKVIDLTSKGLAKHKKKKKKDIFCGLKKTAVMSLCNENNQKKQNKNGEKKENTNIKYNVVAKLVANKFKVAEENLKNKVIKHKSVKDKIMEKKIKKAKLKSKDCVKNLLEGTKNLKTSNRLKTFLQDLQNDK